MTELLRWIETPRNDRGLRFLGDSRDWSFHSYEELAALASGAARQLRDAGVTQGDVVCIFMPTGPLLVSALMGTWMVGGAIGPVAPPMVFEDEAEYAKHLAGILSVARPKVVATDVTYRQLISQIFVLTGSVVPIVELSLVADTELSRQPLGEMALLQFTSGSSGSPRGVEVSFNNLCSNISSIRRWIQMRADDITATWLPLYHDMGLIGCLLTPIVNCSDIWIMRPDQFVRNPLDWIECFGRKKASLCAAPNFGYGYAANRLKDVQLPEECDFSGWRVAIAGAETVDPSALAQFARVLRPFGFTEKAYLPAYGLAEATLAVTGGDPKTVSGAIRPNWETLQFGAPVNVESRAQLGSLPEGSPTGWLVSSGRPHPGTEVSIVDDAGIELGEGVLGEIVVRGPSVTVGYYGTNVESGSTSFTDSGLFTGDAGFVLENELFVVGRMGDSFKIRGRSVYADELESRLGMATQLPPGRCAIVAMPGSPVSTLLVVAEGVGDEWIQQARQVLASIVGEETILRFAVGPRGMISRTSSGKPRRRIMWQKYQKTASTDSETAR